jgi:hypothetical protein
MSDFAPGRLVTMAENPRSGLWTIILQLNETMLRVQRLHDTQNTVLDVLMAELIPADVPPAFLIPLNSLVYVDANLGIKYEYVRRENNIAVVRNADMDTLHSVPFMSLSPVADPTTDVDRPTKRSCHA